MKTTRMTVVLVALLATALLGGCPSDPNCSSTSTSCTGDDGGIVTPDTGVLPDTGTTPDSGMTPDTGTDAPTDVCAPYAWVNGLNWHCDPDGVGYDITTAAFVDSIGQCRVGCSGWDLPAKDVTFSEDRQKIVAPYDCYRLP